MSDPKLGRYAVKYDGKPFAAKTYHLYLDCSYLLSITAPSEGPHQIITPDDNLVDLLGLRVCAGCEARSEITLPEDVMADNGVDADTAKKILADLEAAGYVIKHVRKRVASTDQT